MELETRIEIWERAKYELTIRREDYICRALAVGLWMHLRAEVLISKAFKVFPEALKYEPESKRTTNVWFSVDEDGRQKRIEICNKVIKELKSQL